MSKDDIIYNEKCTKIIYKDKIIDFPFQTNIHELDKEEFIDCLYDLFNKEEKYDNFLDMLYGKFGKSITEKFLKPYNEILYTVDLKELDKNKLNTSITKIDEDNKIAYLSNGNKVEYEYIINTIPLNKFLLLFNNYNELQKNYLIIKY